MARKLQVGESVYAPRSRLGISVDAPSAFYRTTVQAVTDRSVQVDLPDGSLSESIGSWAVHRMIGITIFRIGDFDTEGSLLDPLAKAVLHFSRLLLEPDQVLLREVRTLEEFKCFWTSDRGSTSHMVLIGHGNKTGIRFGREHWVNPVEWADALPLGDHRPKIVLSLCCNTGYKSFGGDFSKIPAVKALLAPFHNVHGGIASQFSQTFLSTQLLEGFRPSVAFRRARESVPGSTSFRLWTNGRLVAGPTG